MKHASVKLTKWPNTLKQFVGNLPTNCLSVFGHFMGLALKGLNKKWISSNTEKWVFARTRVHICIYIYNAHTCVNMYTMISTILFTIYLQSFKIYSLIHVNLHSS